jgi:hypothetical protein
MFPNIGIVALAALVPLVMGFIYYNPALFGKAWMKASGMTEEKIKGANMPLIFISTYILSFIMCIILFTLVVHQTDIHSLFVADEGYGVEGSEVMNKIDAIMETHGDKYRSFGHGALHGSVVGVFLGLPIIVINGLFEAKSFKYGLINAGYWIATLAVAGGVLCAWA